MSIDMIPMPPSVSIDVNPMSIPISVDTDVVSIDMDVMSVATDPVSIDTDPMSKGMWIGMPFMSVRHDPSLDSVPIGHDSHALLRVYRHDPPCPFPCFHHTFPNVD